MITIVVHHYLPFQIATQGFPFLTCVYKSLGDYTQMGHFFHWERDFPQYYINYSEAGCSINVHILIHQDQWKNKTFISFFCTSLTTWLQVFEWLHLLNKLSCNIKSKFPLFIFMFFFKEGFMWHSIFDSSMLSFSLLAHCSAGAAKSFLIKPAFKALQFPLGLWRGSLGRMAPADMWPQLFQAKHQQLLFLELLLMC